MLCKRRCQQPGHKHSFRVGGLLIYVLFRHVLGKSVSLAISSIPFLEGMVKASMKAARNKIPFLLILNVGP